VDYTEIFAMPLLKRLKNVALISLRQQNLWVHSGSGKPPSV
jgi:hypothetical protein